MFERTGLRQVNRPVREIQNGVATYSIFSFYLGRELEHDMQDSRKVGRLSVLQRGLELNLLGSPNRRFIESMTKTLHDALDANLTGRSKNYFQQNFPLNFEATSFFSVNRARLECDLGRDRLR